MDLETENRIASMLLKEAAELRRQAEQEGVLAYLKRPSVRARPNSRFLTSTVRGVEQANRAVEVNEMWRVRQKEMELDNRTKGGSRHGNDHVCRHSVNRDFSMTRCHSHDPGNRYSDVPSSSSRYQNSDRYRPDDDESRDDEGLKDDEVEEFLRSRAKRGRGSIGSRMDEMGPYTSQSSEPLADRLVTSDHAREERWSRVALGPDRPPWKSIESSGDDESEDDDCDRRKKSKKSSSECTKKHHSKKHKSKEKKNRDKKRKKGRHEKSYR